MEHSRYQFSWEASGNPNDPSGVARYKVDDESVCVAMLSFKQALKLDRLIQKACDLSREQLIERSLIDISDLLNRYRYN